MESEEEKAIENQLLDRLRMLRASFGEDIICALLVCKDEIIILKGRIARDVYVSADGGAEDDGPNPINNNRKDDDVRGSLDGRPNYFG